MELVEAGILLEHVTCLGERKDKVPFRPVLVMSGTEAFEFDSTAILEERHSRGCKFVSERRNTPVWSDLDPC